MRIALAVLGLLALAAAGPEAGEWDREIPAVVTLGASHALFRVFDAATGEPVAGAVLEAADEIEHPMPGAWTAARAWVTDRDGFALIDVADRGGWFIVEAKGYAPRAEYGLPEEMSLARGVDAVVEVRDPFDRPLAGAALEYFLGCGHTRDVRRATTDPGGRAVLRGIDPARGDVWVRANGVFGYDSLEAFDERAKAHLVRCDPAPAVEGTVLDAEGRPCAGLAVGGKDFHRGPWTRTDAHGRFRLQGAPWLATLYVESGNHLVGKGPARAALLLFSAAPGTPRTLRLPANPNAQEDTDLEPSLPVKVEVVAAATGAPLESARLVAVRASDGLTVSEWTEGSTHVLELPAGEYRLTVHGPGTRWRPEAVTARPGEDERVTVALRENPTVPAQGIVLVAGSGEPERALTWPLEEDLDLVTALAVVSVTVADGAPPRLYVPESGPFALRLGVEPGYAVCRLSEDLAAGRTGLRFFAPPPPRPEGVPPSEDAPESRFLVLLPDGTPAAGGRYSVTGPGYVEAGALDAGGRCSASAAAGFAFTAETKSGFLPLRFRLPAPGEYTLRWPDTALDLSVEDPEGRALAAFTAAVDGHRVEGTDGALSLRGLPPGPARVLVCAPGRRARDLRVVIPPSGRRAVRACLAPAD